MINEYQKRLMAEGFLLRLASLTNEQERVALVVELMNEMAPKVLSTLYGKLPDGALVRQAKIDDKVSCPPSWLEEQRYNSSNVENIND